MIIMKNFFLQQQDENSLLLAGFQQNDNLSLPCKKFLHTCILSTALSLCLAGCALKSFEKNGLKNSKNSKYELESKLSAYEDMQKDDQMTIHSDQMLIVFDLQLEWYYLYEKRFLEENEKDFKKSGEWKEAYDHVKRADREIQKSKKEFLNFRDTLIQHLTSIMVPSEASYLHALIGSARDEITKTYIKLMQDSVFPNGWEVMFEEYLEEKRKALGDQRRN